MNHVTNIFLGIAVLSLVVIILSAKYIVLAMSNYARKTGLSDYIIGFLIVAIGTALPDISTGIMSGPAHSNELIFGDAIGSTILSSTLVLGITLVIVKRFKNPQTDKTILNETMYTLYLIVLLPPLFGLDGSISRIDGAILLVIFMLYVLNILKAETTFGKIKRSVNLKHILVDMIVFLFALASLLMGARYLVHSCIQISNEMGFSLFIIGLVFVSLANTIPEILIAIKSGLAKHSELSLGNVFGSVALNTTFVLGVSAIIYPIPFNLGNFFLPVIFSIITVVIASIFLRQKEMTYKHGIFLLSLYALFTFIMLYFR